MTLDILFQMVVSAIWAIAIFAGVANLAGLCTWVERKLSSMIQDRIGPNRANIRLFGTNITAIGLLHPIADAVKMFMKEDFVPAGANRVLHTLGPMICLFIPFIVFCVVPFVGPLHIQWKDIPAESLWLIGSLFPGDALHLSDYTLYLIVADLDMGMLFVFGIASLGVYGVLLAGYASNNKFSFLGALRAANQMIGYEVALGLTAVGIFMVYGSMSLNTIVEQQGRLLFGIIPLWGIFTQFPAFPSDEEAARRIGKGAEKFDHNTVKKFEQLPIKLGKLNPAYFLMIATGEDMAITQIEGSFPQDPITDPELKEEFISKWTAVPDKKFAEWFRQWVKRDQLPDEAMVAIVDWNECMHYLDDSLGFCGFVSSFRGQFGGTTGYHVWNMPQVVTHATGWEFDKDRLWACFQRNRNLIRALNNRLGLRRSWERPPEDHWAVRNEEYEQLLLTKYYDFKGWTFDGIPTKATLEKLSLGYVAEDLIKRGVLTGNEVTALNDPRARKDKQ